MQHEGWMDGSRPLQLVDAGSKIIKYLTRVELIRFAP